MDVGRGHRSALSLSGCRAYGSLVAAISGTDYRIPGRPMRRLGPSKTYANSGVHDTGDLFRLFHHHPNAGRCRRYQRMSVVQKEAVLVPIGGMWRDDEVLIFGDQD